MKNEPDIENDRPRQFVVGQLFSVTIATHLASIIMIDNIAQLSDTLQEVLYTEFEQDLQRVFKNQLMLNVSLASIVDELISEFD